MAKKPILPSESVTDEILDAKIKELRDIWAPSVAAGEALDSAKTDAMTKRDTSTRTFTEMLVEWNVELDEAQIKYAGQALSKAIYSGDTVGPMATNFAKLIRNRGHLRQVLNGLDTIGTAMKKVDDKATINIRQHLLSACTAIQDHVKKTGPVDKAVIDGILAAKKVKLMPKAKSETETAIAQLDRLAKAKVLSQPVDSAGKVEAFKPGVEKAIETLRNVIEGVPVPLEQDPRQLKAENEELREELEAKDQEIAELNERLAKASLTSAEPASGPLAAGETEGQPTTGDDPEAIEELATKLPGASEVAKPAKAPKDRREDSVKGSVMGPEGDFLGLLGGLGIKG